MCIYLSLSKYVRLHLSLHRVDIFFFSRTSANVHQPICHVVSVRASVYVFRRTKPLTSNKNPARQIRLLKQSAITPLTCSSWKLTLTVMDSANEASKCERCMCALVRESETFT